MRKKKSWSFNEGKRVYVPYFMVKVDYYMNRRKNLKSVKTTEVHVFLKNISRRTRFLNKHIRFLKRVKLPKSRFPSVDNISERRVDYLYNKK